jgi:glycyl-tRNA synthetase beta chain
MLQAFDEASGTEWFGSLVLSAVRVNNILDKLQDSEFASIELDREKLGESAETNLLCILDKQGDVVRSAVERCDWKAVCKALAALSPAISNFFESTMIMADDISVRNNRLALLVECKALFGLVGDFSLIK